MKIRTDSGFTLIELIVVTSLLVVIGVLIASIIVSTLRSSSKTKITTAVTQNGSYALSVITDIIHDSDAVVNAPTDLGINNCTLAPTVPPPLSQINLHRLRSANEQKGGYTTLSCVSGPPGRITVVTTTGAGVALPTQNLIDSSQVSLTSCQFTCSQADVFTPPTISVQFGLNSSKIGGDFEKQAAASFSTQVSMSNYLPR